MDNSSGEPAPSQAGPGEPPPPRRRGRPPGKPLSGAELAARRANLEFARAAPRDRIYRRTRRRREASRRNIQRALAWRRSPQGNARARLNAFQHGLAAKTSPELRAALGESPEDFARHLELISRVFRPLDQEEARLIERLAQATWQHMRVFRAQARLERFAWRRLVPRTADKARPGHARGLHPPTPLTPPASSTTRPLTLEETSERAYEVSKLFAEARLVESEAYKLEDRVERILAALIRLRAKGDA
ncbi:MAG: hypothetical protein LAN62_12420 [Acidobacteriia bacterium]|nr:hypothetical protein [Terriglobia bacterium]